MVQTDKNHVLLVDEKNVRLPVHLGSKQSAGQLLDRIGWAIGDAERRTARRTVRKYVAAVVPPSVQRSSRTAKAQERARRKVVGTRKAGRVSSGPGQSPDSSR
jgi:hypothetical protein